MFEAKTQLIKLFSQVQAGSEQAFDELFRLYYERLVHFGTQYVSLEQAEEITSELFVKLWLKNTELTRISNPEVYLYVAIKNACFNALRREVSKAPLFVHPADASYTAANAREEATKMEENELVDQINNSVDALPEQQRIVFRLIKEDDLKSHMVAAILGISVRTVENQLYKALKTIANHLSGYLGYHPQKKRREKKVLSILRILFL